MASIKLCDQFGNVLDYGCFEVEAVRSDEDGRELILQGYNESLDMFITIRRFHLDSFETFDIVTGICDMLNCITCNLYDGISESTCIQIVADCFPKYFEWLSELGYEPSPEEGGTVECRMILKNVGMSLLDYLMIQ